MHLTVVCAGSRDGNTAHCYPAMSYARKEPDEAHLNNFFCRMFARGCQLTAYWAGSIIEVPLAYGLPTDRPAVCFAQ